MSSRRRGWGRHELIRSHTFILGASQSATQTRSGPPAVRSPSTSGSLQGTRCSHPADRHMGLPGIWLGPRVSVQPTRTAGAWDVRPYESARCGRPMDCETVASLRDGSELAAVTENGVKCPSRMPGWRRSPRPTACTAIGGRCALAARPASSSGCWRGRVRGGTRHRRRLPLGDSLVA
jgi:hypothetical protein